ncbi:MAG: hypothetical protein ABSB33_09715 [Tepidisphaeraceae bacterium]
MLDFRRWIWAVGCLALAACGGQQASSTDQWNGPTVLASVSVDDAAPSQPNTAKVVRTQHYLIYSTIQDRPDLLSRMGQLMEGAYGVYRTLAPTAPPTTYPMQCYLFNTRLEWMDFTRRHTGRDASIYLQISRGGYTLHDWYVAYYIGEIGTYSVSAHEGWHQFVGRHFKGRLPPFLEEGMACMFENVQWDNDLPRFNLSLNPDRTQALRKAEDEGELFSLNDLITLHAGQVVGRSDVRIQAWYAQDWAFARFLREGEDGKYRPALQKLLADTAAGTVYDPTGSLRLRYLGWNPAGVKPLLEHYLGEDLSVTEQGYDQFMHKVAYEEMKEQFQMQ